MTYRELKRGSILVDTAQSGSASASDLPSLVVQKSAVSEDFAAKHEGPLSSKSSVFQTFGDRCALDTSYL
jgi:hypothetical protein